MESAIKATLINCWRDNAVREGGPSGAFINLRVFRRENHFLHPLGECPPSGGVREERGGGPTATRSVYYRLSPWCCS